MATIVDFQSLPHDRVRRRESGEGAPCEIVIFPGARIDRPVLDLSYRLRDTVGRSEFKDIGKDQSRRRS